MGKISTNRIKKNVHVWRLIGLFVLALGVRLAAVYWWRFDGLYGQDAYAYFDQARAILHAVPQGQIIPADFFWPHGFPLLVALFMALLGETAVAAQLPVLLCGAALAPLAYSLSRELLPAEPGAAWLAAFIVAVAGQPVLSSLSVMADVPALFWATLAAWLLVRGWRRPRPAFWLAAAGAALALAIINRWLYLLLLPAFGVYTLMQLRRKRAPARLLLGPLLAGLLVLLPQLWLSRQRPDGLLHSWLLGWQPQNAWLRHFENVDGHFSYRLPVALFYAGPAAHPAYLFPLLGLAAVWAVYCLARQKEWPALALLLGWSGAVYLFLAGIPYQNFRFGLALYMPVLLLAGYGAADLWRRWSGKWRLALLTAVILSLAGTIFWSYRLLDNFLTAQNRTRAVAYQVEQLLEPEATLLTFGPTLVISHSTGLAVRELYDLEPAALADLLALESSVYLLLDVANVSDQWHGRSPQINYEWLRQEANLETIAIWPPYTLFSVRQQGER
jgi:4-amino-4-deoxy-L-arabinose transferase-like glycosyltransferase